jgi:chromosomal replication initiation ATPase DnaA
VTPTARAIKAVCDFYSIHPRRLLEGGKTPHLADARAVAMWLCRNWAGLSLPKTARSVGLKDHTSAIAAVRKVERRADLMSEAKGLMGWLDGEREEQSNESKEAA